MQASKRLYSLLLLWRILEIANFSFHVADGASLPKKSYKGCLWRWNTTRSAPSSCLKDYLPVSVKKFGPNGLGATCPTYGARSPFATIIEKPILVPQLLIYTHITKWFQLS